jgi:Uma2 family endonuclease
MARVILTYADYAALPDDGRRCELHDTTVVQPDIVFVDTPHASRVSERAIEGAPTLAIEVLSPSSERTDRGRKFDLYARHGIAYYWTVDSAARMIDAYVLEAEAYRLTTRLVGDQPAALPPFADLLLDPAALWA